MSNTASFLLGILAMCFAVFCTGVISYSNALGTEPMFEGYMGVLVPLVLIVITFIAGIVSGSAYGGEV